MNEQENGNLLIAKFMNFPTAKLAGQVSPSVLKYHKDWNWLMNVVNQIESTNEEYDVRILGQDCEVISYDGDIIIEMVHAPTKIEATWRCVLEFIEWYNVNKAK